jgi:hypothetical protein
MLERYPPRFICAAHDDGLFLIEKYLYWGHNARKSGENKREFVD